MSELAERLRNEIAAVNELGKDGNVTLLWDCLEEIEQASRRSALTRMMEIDEELGAFTAESLAQDALALPRSVSFNLYHGKPVQPTSDDALPEQRRTIGSATDRFIEPLRFARYYIVEALEFQEQSDLRDALVTLDWLIDGDAK